MSHATCLQGNQVDSWLLVVGSQIANLTHGLSFGHNLCFRCLNGSCEPILDIYVSIDFQWYKKCFNPMGFDPCKGSLKIQKSNSPSESSFGSVRALSLTLSYTLGSIRCASRASSLSHILASPCFGCKPKVRVVIENLVWMFNGLAYGQTLHILSKCNIIFQKFWTSNKGQGITICWNVLWD
jgi:hypothetical protein